jgi:predicted anti-sigma-YlaC factor YlaD
MTDCDRLSDLAAELALGIADGADRAWALEHLAGCCDCRARVERLAGLADELLLVAPAAEPPPGFEARVVEAIRPPARSRARRFAIPVAAAVAAAACAAAAVWIALGDDREHGDY